MAEDSAPPKDITTTWNDVGAQATAVAVVAPSPKLTKKQAEERELKQIESKIFEKSAQVVGTMMDFDHFESDQDDEEADEKYVAFIMRERGVTKEQAQRMCRVAKAGWSNAKEAPVALKYASATMVGIMKARQQDAPQQQINIGKAYIAAELPPMKTIEVKE